MKKSCLKLVSLVMCMVMLLSFVPLFASAKDAFEITNPYAKINWGKTKQYKTALHTHTNATDGDITLKQSLQRHVEAGFDAVATTDHGIVNYSWTSKDNVAKLMHNTMNIIGKNEGKLDVLSKSGKFANGIKYKMVKKSGDDYLSAKGREMLRIPYGIENNAISVNAHVNSWFADFNRNVPSDYEDAVKGVEAKGGLCIINHPGEYSDARYELLSEDAYDMNNLSYRYLFQKWYGIINKYDSCLGIDINSKGDDRTRYDRKLWDLMLAKAAKSGKTVLAIASSDAHQADKVDTGCVYILADKNNSSSVKKALKNGEFLASSTCIGNYDELVQIANSIKKYYGKTKLYNELTKVIKAYEKELNEKLKSSDKGNVNVKYEAIDKNGYFSKKARPQVSSISVDDKKNTITVKTKNALIVRWISDGKLIATTKAGTATIDLDNYADKIKGYVRAEVFGEGGIIYTQSFTLNAKSAQQESTSFVNLGMLDFLFAEIDMYVGLLARMIKNLF